MTLTVNEAEMELGIGAKKDPGPWIQHSISAANNARFATWSSRFYTG